MLKEMSARVDGRRKRHCKEGEDNSIALSPLHFERSTSSVRLDWSSLPPIRSVIYFNDQNDREDDIFGYI